jgi:thioredoxin 1
MQTAYIDEKPARAWVDSLRGAAVLEFGSPWCGHCRRAQPLIAEALSSHPGVLHVKIHDAKGKPLGRSFGIKLWPTLVFLLDGREVARCVRPVDVGELREALRRIDVRSEEREAD